jgi:hypothetical protein
MKLTNFLRLDIKTINPYFSLIHRLYFIGFVFVVAFVLEFFVKIHIPFLTFMFFGMIMFLIGSFPFALETKNDTNTFYITQKIPRKTVVYGRFLYGFFVSFLCVAISAIIDISVLVVSGYSGEIKNELLVAAAVLVALQILNAFRFPFFFKFGYAKGSVAASIVFMVIGIVVILPIAVYNYNNFTMPNLDVGTVLVILGITIIITVIAVAVSMKLSVKFYKSREF